MAKAEKAKGFIKEFKEFALQGNLFDMAVGVLIGGVFKDLVASFTNNIIMPIISIFTGSIDFSSWKIALPSLFGDKIDPETGEVVVNYLKFGLHLECRRHHRQGRYGLGKGGLFHYAVHLERQHCNRG